MYIIYTGLFFDNLTSAILYHILRLALENKFYNPNPHLNIAKMHEGLLLLVVFLAKQACELEGRIKIV